ncbi:hypothetical protein HDU86_003054 [Geranomyces michiganensis]|nr:hypothetical protein HDU86_003054 [Geranomyces michiganensis]
MHPALKASLTSGVLFTAGDILSQKLVPSLASHNLQQGMDWPRTAKFGLCGALLHGPYFLYGFRQVDRLIGGGQPTFLNAVKKAAVSQITLFPVFIVSFLSLSALLDGASPAERVRQKFSEVFVNGALVWPLANVISFRFVPVALRIPYVNLVGLGWNTYLSTVNGARLPEHEIPV